MAFVNTSNLTGGQIQDVLDHLIYRGLEPLVLHSSVFDSQVAHLLTIAATNKKRKLSALDREVFVSQLCRVLATTNPTEKFELVSAAKIERSFVYGFLVNFLKATEQYRDLHVRYLSCSDHVERSRLESRMAVIENSVGFSRERLFSAVRVCEHYVALAYEFRNAVVEQYLKHGYKKAHAYCKSTTRHLDFKEVYQSFLAAITKSLDKYDSSKGALTSYVDYWLLNAMTYANPSYGHEYGIAYSMPQTQNRKGAAGEIPQQVNFSVSLDSLVGKDDDESTSLLNMIPCGEGLDRDMEASEEEQLVLYLAKHADPSGLARLYLDLGEYFFNKELVQMAVTTISQTRSLPEGAPTNVLQAAERRIRSMRGSAIVKSNQGEVHETRRRKAQNKE